MRIYNIINELNENNSTNYKLETLAKYKDNELLKRVLKMCYDKVTYTYGIGKTTLLKLPAYENNNDYPLSKALDVLEQEFCTREVTGLVAIQRIYDLLSHLDFEDSEIVKRILERDLKINMGKTQINKVFKDLIVKPPYMRCSLLDSKTVKGISFPAICQTKADGMFSYVIVEDGQVEFVSRSGETNIFPHLEKEFQSFPDGVYIGELLVQEVTDRSVANGFINSDEEDKSSVYIQLWDYIKLEEFARPKDKDSKTRYMARLVALGNILGAKNPNFIKGVKTEIVNSLDEAVDFCVKIMESGGEGAILKDKANIFLDHTSKTQLKMKLEISLEMRVIGFKDGKVGTKREGKVGSIEFSNDEGTVRGYCSGFTDKELDYFTDNKEKFLGKIIEVKCNDITKARDKDYYALSHPRLIEVREDKNETDSLETCFSQKEASIQLMKLIGNKSKK